MCRVSELSQPRAVARLPESVINDSELFRRLAIWNGLSNVNACWAQVVGIDIGLRFSPRARLLKQKARSIDFFLPILNYCVSTYHFSPEFRFLLIPFALPNQS